MKVTTALSTLPPRPTLYSKSSIKRSKVNSPTIASSSSTLTNNSNAGSNFSNGSNSNNGGVSKRKDSPLKQSFRRTSPELLAIELKKLNDEKSRLVRESLNLSNNKELVDLLELEYRDDVKNWLFFMEEKTSASVELIDLQPEVRWYMRPYLVDFLVEIHLQFRLRPETLYLALNIVDRYVSKRIVFKKHYQLVGCVGLWIASKFEDAKDRVPSLPELASMCSGAYDESAFVQMEQHILASINWVVGHPTTESWLRMACVTKVGLVEEKMTQNLARFLMEITLFHKEFLVFKSSELAVASLVLARFILGKSRRVMDESVEVLKIASLLDSHFAERLETVSATVVKKYAPAYFSKASTYCLEWYLSGKRFTYHTSFSTSLIFPTTATTTTPSLLFTSSPLSSSSTSSSQNSSVVSSPASSTFSSRRRCFDSPVTQNDEQDQEDVDVEGEGEDDDEEISYTSTLPCRSNSNSSNNSSQSSTFSYRSNSTAPSSIACSSDDEGEDLPDTPLLDCYSPAPSSTFSSRPNSYYEGMGMGMGQKENESSMIGFGRIEKSPAPVSFRRIPLSPSNSSYHSS